MKNDIGNIDDIKVLVDSFYGKIRNDSLLKDIFNNKIAGRWPEHLEKMYRFWQTVLLEEHTYYGSPFMPHANLAVERQHFDRWVKLFSETVDGLFSGEIATKAKNQAERLAEIFLSKIDYSRNNPLPPIR